MEGRKEKKTRRYQFAVAPSFGRVFDALCRKTGNTRTDVFVHAVTRVINETVEEGDIIDVERK